MLLQTLPCASPAVFAPRRARVSRSPVCSAVKDDTARVSSAFKATFAQHAAHVSRAYESWARMARGDPMYECSHPGQGLQQATGYVDGLTAVAFHEASTCAPWMRVLEAQVGVIQGELRAALSPESAAAVARNGSNVWSPAARADAMSYGPQWKTLGLQDRSQWDAANSKLFPLTCRLVRDTAAVPSVECFFARQAPGSGIKPHSDFNNFILTAHLGLDVPEGQCWIQVGDHKRGWLNGVGMVFDTSFVHQTLNESDRERYVLLIRFWHPELTLVERCAIQFLIDCSEDESPQGIMAATKAAEKRLAKLGKTTRGFGKQ